VIGLLVAAVALAGCGGADFADRTARVEIGGRTTTYEVDDCGLDGQTLFVVGRAPDGSVLQAVVGLKADDRTGILASSGLTFSDEGVDYAAFGSESWSRRDGSGRAPGRVTEAALRGSRIQVSGVVEEVDDRDRPEDPPLTTPFALDARCDEAN
jgi:hypothetical protein